MPDRILKGDKPGDLPVHCSRQSLSWSINLKTAKAIGLDDPAELVPVARRRGDRMRRRRQFITLLGGAAAAWPIAVRAQQARKVPRDRHPGLLSIGRVCGIVSSPFRQGLRELGYVEGGNIHVEYHSAEQRSDLAATIAADLVRRKVDVIVAVATPAAHAAKNATATIPIVMSGLRTRWQPGWLQASRGRAGTSPGVSCSGPDLAGKRLELLRELRPES